MHGTETILYALVGGTVAWFATGVLLIGLLAACATAALSPVVAWANRARSGVARRAVGRQKVIV